MKLDVFLKGLLMGVCDLVPGISGGTIAFITGIYERLIKGVSGILNLSVVWILLITTALFLIRPGKKNLGKVKEIYREYDVVFLFTLGLGIVTALVLGARGIVFLLDSYFVFTMSFFVGLIVASSVVIYEDIDDHRVKDRIFGVIGFLVGVAFLFLVPVDLEISLGYVFLSGFVGVSAMFLPGISGSYLLYILGSYEYMLHALKDPLNSVIIIFMFILGAILGAVWISRFIVFMFKNYRSRMLYVLFGFVLGALAVPVRDIFDVGFSFLGVIFFLLGFLIILLVSTFKGVSGKF